jgi:hypothetical protein
MKRKQRSLMNATTFGFGGIGEDMYEAKSSNKVAWQLLKYGDRLVGCNSPCSSLFLLFNSTGAIQALLEKYQLVCCSSYC